MSKIEKVFVDGVLLAVTPQTLEVHTAGEVHRFGETVPTDPTPVVPPPSTRKRIEVTQATIATDLKKVRDDTDLLFPSGKTITLPFGVNVVHDRVHLDVYGGTEKCTLVANGEISVVLNIAGTADKARVRNLHLTCTEENYKQWPHAVHVSGTNATFNEVTFANVRYGFNNKSSARNTTVTGCENTGTVAEHWFYDNGRGTVIEENHINSPWYTSYRCNNVNNVLILNNVIRGGSKQQGRLTIQKGDGFLVEGNEFHDTHIGNGPLGGADGYKQEGGKDGMLKARTLNTVWRNNRGHNVKLIVGNRTENTRIEGNTGMTVVIEKDTLLDPKKYGLTGDAFMLPGAKNVVTA